MTIKLRRKLLSFALLAYLALHTGQLSAVPANPTPVNVMQPNGKELTVMIFGDESFHYATTTDGFIVVRESDGGYYYAVPDSDQLISSGIVALNATQRTVSDAHFLNTIDQHTVNKLLSRQCNAGKLRMSASDKPDLRVGNFPSEGQQKALIILVEFQNLTFTIENPKQAFHDLLNGEGYSLNGASGSARDYFIENSMGKFRPDFEVYGPVKVSKNIAYYGKQISSSVTDENPREMILEACALLAEQGVDFSQYDADADGLVDNIYVFYAGHGQADTPANTDAIWPHSWNVSEFNVEYNGVKLNTYACSGELLGGTQELTGIGTFVHEFCHVLGLPDLYATRSYINAFTPGAWSVLASGPYNNNQKTPPFFTAYERYFLGWLEPEELHAEANVTLEAINENKAHIIKTNNPNEYYLLENRQQTAWDAYLPGHGMLVWHIDYNEELWETNTVNNDPEHQHVDIVEADNTQTEGSRRSDVFPGTLHIASFTDQTAPSMKTWAGVALNKPLTEIKEEDGLVSFRFMGGKDLSGVVTLKPASNLTQTSFTANWEAHPGATSYLVSVYQKDNDASIKYVAGYKDADVGNVTSLEIAGLEPGVDYYYKAMAKDAFSQTAYSEENKATTSPPTFEFLSPIAAEATSVDLASFVANWEAMEGAVSYLLTVYKKTYGDPVDTETVDFTQSLQSIPSTWSTNCSQIFGQAGYYGQARFALRFDENGQFIRTPFYEEGISGLSFWHRGYNSTGANSIVVKGSKNVNWETISVVPLVNEEGGQTVSLGIDALYGYKAIEIAYAKTGNGSFALDDLLVETGAQIQKEPIGGYDKWNTGNVVSCKIEGLEPNEYYYYTVLASNGDVYSSASNEIKVYTRTSSSIENKTNDTFREVGATKDYIYVRSTEKVKAQVSVYSVTGQTLYDRYVEGEIHIPSRQLPAGIYIVRVNERTYKVTIQ